MEIYVLKYMRGVKATTTTKMCVNKIADSITCAYDRYLCTTTNHYVRRVM